MQARRTLHLALTGGIGSGKSTALAAFARRGVPTLSSDAVVHGLYRQAAVRDAVVARLGPGVLGPDGEVDRAAVGRRAFADPAVLRFLEGLLHPLVGAEGERFRAAAEEAGEALTVQEVPLLFESGGAGRYDRTVLVTAPDAVRRGRDPERFDRRSGAQLPEADKRRLADEVYDNVGTPEELDAWIGALVERLVGERAAP